MIQNKYSENRITAINRVLLNLWLTKHNKRILFPYIRALGRRMGCWSSSLPWSHSCTQSHRGFAGFSIWLPGHSHKETDFFFPTEKCSIIQISKCIGRGLRKTVSNSSLYSLCGYSPLTMCYFEHLFLFSCLSELALYLFLLVL